METLGLLVAVASLLVAVYDATKPWDVFKKLRNIGFFLHTRLQKTLRVACEATEQSAFEKKVPMFHMKHNEMSHGSLTFRFYV
jgi:hypothetical protein